MLMDWKGDGITHTRMWLAFGLYAMGTLELTYAAVTAIPTKSVMLCCSQTCVRWRQPSTR
ncbi:hypothetical protein D3C76_1508810 [compost metagenome]